MNKEEQYSLKKRDYIYISRNLNHLDWLACGIAGLGKYEKPCCFIAFQTGVTNLIVRQKKS